MTVPQVPTLTTPRFTMRPLRRSDAAALFPTLSDPAFCLYLSRPAFESEEELWGWLAEPDWPGRSWIAEDAEGVAGRFVAVPYSEAEGGEGSPEEGAVEIGYITCADRLRQGVARECMAALIEHLWREGAPRLIAEIDPRNDRSIALAEALGFAYLRTELEAETTHAGLCDLAIYELHSPHTQNG